jgi:hypothetical protein
MLKYWPSKENTDECINSQAENSKITLAVHEPIVIEVEKRLGVKETNSVRIKDIEMFDEFVNDTNSEGQLLWFIKGQSGVGKSHLVKWFYEKLLIEYKDTPCKIIILIPKSDSLRAIIETILKKTNNYEKYKEKLNNAGAIQTLDYYRQIFRAELISELKRRNGEYTNSLQGSLEHRRKTEITEGFIEYLEDIVTGKYFFDKVEEHILANVITGRRDPEKPESVITEEYFHINPNIRSAALRAQSYHNRINIKINAHIKPLLVQFLNDMLDTVIAQVFNFQYKFNINEVFKDIRKELMQKDKNTELIMLVEDFADTTGIKKDIIEMAITPGENKLCGIKTMIAVTEGYHVDYDTIDTRCSQYLIRESFESQNKEEIIKRVLGLTGRYLNAARHGLENVLEQKDNIRDFCEINSMNNPKERQVLNAFGKSDGQSGYYLFPFNKASLEKLFEEKFVDKEKGAIKFNARNIITSIIHPVLNARSLFDKGKFPNAVFKPSLDDDKLLRHINQIVVDENEKVRYLRFFSNYYNKDSKWSDIKRIMEVFKLPTSSWENVFTENGENGSVVVTPADTPGIEILPPPPAISAEEQAIKEWDLKINEWSTDKDKLLNATNASGLRNILLKCIEEYLFWKYGFKNESIIKVNDIFLPATDRSYPDAYCKVIDDEKEFEKPNKALELKRNLKASIRFWRYGYKWNFKDSEVYRPYYFPFIASLSEQIYENYIAVKKDFSDDELSLLVKCLYLGSYVLGMKPPVDRSEKAKKIWRVFEPNIPENPNINSAPQEWRILYNSCREIRGELLEELCSRVGIYQGTGKTLFGIKEPEKIISILNNTNLDYKLLGNNPRYDKVKENYYQIRKIRKSIDEFKKYIKDVIELINKNIGTTSTKELYDKVNNLLSRFTQAGLNREIKREQYLHYLQEIDYEKIIKDWQKVVEGEMEEFLDRLNHNNLQILSEVQIMINDLNYLLETRTRILIDNNNPGFADVNREIDKFNICFDSIVNSIAKLIKEKSNAA